MKNSEFSDSFDSLLNSYASRAQFGDEAARSEIVLDEYEKSVLLTQAQDIVIKSFFDRRHNAQGEGFDDSTRRQVDFSSLVTVATLEPYTVRKTFSLSDGNGQLGTLTVVNYSKKPVHFILRSIEERLLSANGQGQADGNGFYVTYDADSNELVISIATDSQAYNQSDYTMDNAVNSMRNSNVHAYADHATSLGKVSDYIGLALSDANPDEVFDAGSMTYIDTHLAARDVDTFDDRGIIYKMPLRKYPSVENGTTVWKEREGSTEVLYILNEKVQTRQGSLAKTYVVVPINYKEYDREMAKAYAQPLKKQVWRLLQNSTQGFDIQSELVPRWNLTKEETITSYKIRYIRRPCPIILTDLPDNLEIDGFTKSQECELNPIIHPEILQKAVELAISTRGVSRADNQRERENA